MKYTSFWRAKWTADGSKTLQEMSRAMRQAADELDEMAAAGVALEGVVDGDYAHLYTEDPAVAERFGFLEEDVDPDGLDVDVKVCCSVCLRVVDTLFFDELEDFQPDAGGVYRDVPFVCVGCSGGE